MSLTSHQIIDLTSEIENDPAALGLHTKGLSRENRSLDFYIWNTLRGAEDGTDRLSLIGCVGTTIEEVSAILDTIGA